MLILIEKKYLLSYFLNLNSRKMLKMVVMDPLRIGILY